MSLPDAMCAAGHFDMKQSITVSLSAWHTERSRPAADMHGGLGADESSAFPQTKCLIVIKL